MKLRQIEAVRFGALADASLGEFGDGLTVVLGPNEAGKTTYTALVRAILYGFPTASKDGAYLSVAGKRMGRLVFEEAGTRWVLERAEGPHGGPWSVRALNGRERPGLRDEIVSGVSEEAFRVVFGFGLDDMARIETLRGSGDDIIAPLYAASVGLQVSPQEVRTRIEREADEIFAPRARKKRVHELMTELAATRSALKEARDAGARYAQDRARLRELEASLAQARASRDSLRLRAAEVEGALSAYEERIAQIKEREAELQDLRRQRATSVEALERVEVDDRALGLAAEIDALAEQAPVIAQLAEEVRAQETEAAAAEHRFAGACAEIGWTTEQALAVDVGPAFGAEVEAARDEVQRLDADREAREREAERMTAAAGRAEKAATEALAQVSLALDADAETELDARAAELDALDAGAGAAPGRRVDVPALVLLIAGLLTAVAGAVLREYVSAVIGAVLAAAGAVLVLRARRAAPAPAPATETFRLRRALDAARAALGAYREAARDAEEAARAAAAVTAALEARRALFASSLRDAGFGVDLTPAAAAPLLGYLKDARRVHAAAQEAAARVLAGRERLEGFAARVGELAVAALPDAAPSPAVDEVAPLLGRLREALAQARAARERRERLAESIAQVDERVAASEGRLMQQRADEIAILARFDLTEGGSAAALEALARETRQREAEAEAVHDAVAEETARLAGALETLAAEDHSAALRLNEAALRERLADAADRYAVLAVAARLLATAQEQYERERQPDVVKRAETVFRTITQDRYQKLAMPLGEGRIEVFDGRSGAHQSAELSRGTAEALYLSLRLGLVAHLGDVGPGLPLLMDDVLVNFDPERRAGAARAVAELADERQVIVFTCHPETAELLGELAHDPVVIELGRCSL